MATTCCNIERPDPQELFNKYKNMFQNIVLAGGQVIPESNEWYAVSLNYAMAEEFYALAEAALRERDPRTACCDNLISIAASNGVYPLPAQYAQGYIKVTGTPGAVLPSPFEVTVNDQLYIGEDNQPTQIGADGSVVIRVRALVPGAVGNISATVGYLTSPAVGIDNEVQVCGGTFCNGEDAETCEQFRTRYLERMQYTPRATNEWIIQKLLEWPCATRAIQRAGTCCQTSDCPDSCECSCRNCGADLAFYVMFDNSFPCGIPPESVTQEIEDWLFGDPQGYGLGQMEVGICGKIVTPTAIMVDVYVDIEGCPTNAQLEQIETQIIQYFGTLAPSTLLRTRTVEFIIASQLGTDVNFEVYFQVVPGQDLPEGAYYISACGDLEPACDYLPCLNQLNMNQAASGAPSC